MAAAARECSTLGCPRTVVLLQRRLFHTGLPKDSRASGWGNALDEIRIIIIMVIKLIIILIRTIRITLITKMIRMIMVMLMAMAIIIVMLMI